MSTFAYYVPGLLLILLGILVLAVPEILVALIAAMIFMAGVSAIYIGHEMRKSDKDFYHSSDLFFNDGFFRKPFGFSRWQRWF